MTLEQLMNKIIQGQPAASLEDAAAGLKLLVAFGGRIDAMIALLLEESKRLYVGAGWAKWAVAEFGMADENACHHRRAVGAMLYAIRERSVAMMAKFIDVDITKLDAIVEIHNNRGVDLVITFVKLHPEWSKIRRDKLRILVKSFLYPERTSPAAEQLELGLHFDVINDVIDVDRLLKVTSRPDFGGTSAFVMAVNGAKLCAAALPAWSDEVELDDLEEIKRDLDQASTCITQLLTSKKQQQLN